MTIEGSTLENTVYYASHYSQNGGPTHNDNIQILKGDNIRIIGNTIRGSQNFAVLGAPEQGTMRNLLVQGNNTDDGHCTMKFATKGGFAQSVTVRDNRVGAHQAVRGCGIVVVHGVNLTESGNRWTATGAAGGHHVDQLLTAAPGVAGIEHDGPVTTIVFLHAHPDDEASQTSGLDGPRSSTRATGSCSSSRRTATTAPPPTTWPTGETLVDRSRRELAASARAIGIHRVEWLGYADSGISGCERDGPRARVHGRRPRRRRPAGWSRSSTRRTPTSPSGTTGTVGTATPTTSRCTGSCTGPPSSRPAVPGSSRAR